MKLAAREHSPATGQDMDDKYLDSEELDINDDLLLPEDGDNDDLLEALEGMEDDAPLEEQQ